MEFSKKTSHDLSHSTMAFMAEEKDGSWGTLVYEEGVKDPIFVASPPGKLIEAAHRQNGEELIGRSDGARILCGFNNKSPVAISVTNKLYFFPTHSPSNPGCSWFSHTHIKQIKKTKYGGSKVIFTDGQYISIPVSEGIMLNQLHRTAQFRFALEQQLKPVRQQETYHLILKLLGYDNQM